MANNLCGLMDIAGTGYFCPVHGWMVGAKDIRQAKKMHKEATNVK